MLNTGTIVNHRYRIAKLLGQGGFGAVYRAWDINLNRACALKINLETSLEAQRQFRREADTLAALSHPNLPRVTDHFFVEGQGQFLVMDYVDGEDLEHVLAQNGRLSPEKALPIIAQVADALGYLHQQNPPIIHRDIKPANIRITADGRVSLVDFGLVKVYDQKLRTTIGARAVTPGYSPPEQYGQGNTDTRTDVYALAATLYTMLTGEEPQESVQRIVEDQLRPAHEVTPIINPQMSQTLFQAMSLAPSGRYQTVSDFMQSLSIPNVTPVSPLVESIGTPVKVSAPPISQPVTEKGGGPFQWIIGTALFLSAIFLFFVLPATRQQTAQAIALQITREAATQQARQAATATTVARNNMIVTLEAQGVRVFGPRDGVLPHTDSAIIETYSPFVSLKNFIAEATFNNPYTGDVGQWSYGFLFRNQATAKFMLSIRSNRTWELLYFSGGQWTQVSSGTITNLLLSANGTNHIRVICRDNQGWLYVNNEFVAELDLSSISVPGNVIIATGLHAGDKVDGKETRYTGFTIWSLP